MQGEGYVAWLCFICQTPMRIIVQWEEELFLTCDECGAQGNYYLPKGMELDPDPGVGEGYYDEG